MLVNPSGDAWHSKRSKKLPDTDNKLENQFFLVHLNYNDKNDRLTVTTLLSCFLFTLKSLVHDQSESSYSP